MSSSEARVEDSLARTLCVRMSSDVGSCVSAGEFAADCFGANDLSASHVSSARRSYGDGPLPRHSTRCIVGHPFDPS